MVGIAVLANVIAAGLLWASGEIVQNFSLTVKRGTLNITKAVAITTNMTATAPNVAGGTINVGTVSTGTIVNLAYVTTNGVAWFGNLSTNNFVELGVQVAGDFYPLVRINAGESYPLRLSQGIQPFLRANTASVVTEYYIFDN